MKAILLIISISLHFHCLAQHDYRSEKIYFSLDKQWYLPGDSVKLSGIITEAQTLIPQPYCNYLYVELINRADSVLTMQKLACNDGTFSATIPLDPLLMLDSYYLRAYTQLMRNYPEKVFPLRIFNIGTKTINQQIDSNTLGELLFYPEGGHLVNGQLQKIVLLAKNNYNNPMEATLILMTNQGDTLKSTVTTSNTGLGILNFIPEQNEQYQVLVQTESGTQSFPLPLADTKVTIQAHINRQILDYSILEESIKKTENANYRMLIFYRGICCTDTLLNKNIRKGKIDFTGYPEGVITCLLADTSYNILAERNLYLHDSKKEPSFSSFSPERICQPNDTIALSLTLPDTTNYYLVRFRPYEETIPESIQDYLLFNSDLTFPISPLLSISSLTDNELDNLMCTATWKRYYWNEVLTKTFQYRYPIEKVISLKGTVTKENGKVLNNGYVIAFDNQSGHTYETIINPNGTFEIGTDDFPDSSSFFLQAYNIKGKWFNFNISMNNDTYPPVTSPLKFIQNNQNYNLSSNIITADSISCYYDLDSNKIYRLPDIQIIANIKKEQEPTKQFYQSNFIGPEILEETSYTDLIGVFDRMPFIELKQVCNDDNDCRYALFSQRGPSTFPQGQDNSLYSRLPGEIILLIDGVKIEGMEMNHYILGTDPHTIESIERLTPGQAIAYTSFAIDGAVYIKTKNHKEKMVPTKGIQYTPKGVSYSNIDKSLKVKTIKEGAPLLLTVPPKGKWILTIEGVGKNGIPFTYHQTLLIEKT